MGAQDTYRHAGLAESDIFLLDKITADLPILADLSRSDVQLCCRTAQNKVLVCAHAAPHSVAPIYPRDEPAAGSREQNSAEVIAALSGKLNPSVVHTLEIRGGLVARQINPIRNAQGALLAVLTKDSYWLAHERQKRRAKVFQQAQEAFIAMVLRGELENAEALSPFGEHDGIIFVTADRTVRYMSGVAAGLYRHLGYRDSLVGHRINELAARDQQLVNQVISERLCIEDTDEQDGLTWVRKALPLYRPPYGWFRRLWDKPSSSSDKLAGVFLLIHDDTESVQTLREIESKMALIREVHHRVKNNLQVIASLMRMQARRVSSDEAKAVLEESVNRVLSVAVVHEFLSQNANGAINLQEVAHRIVAQMHQGLIDPSRHITLSVEGDDIWLPAERATQCALVINELVQNALEHGLEHRDQGIVKVELHDLGDQVKIVVSDNGEGLPDGFDLGTSSSLGLRIVRSLVERDLRGQLVLESETGTQAVVIFGKSILGG